MRIELGSVLVKSCGWRHAIVLYARYLYNRRVTRSTPREGRVV